MKVVSFFSRFAVICNIAFLLFILLGKIEAAKPVAETRDVATPVSYFKDVIITLGIAAIVVNTIVCIVYAILIIIGRQRLIPKSLAVVNSLFLIFQVIYFFFR